jgi:hypothetical protein
MAEEPVDLILVLLREIRAKLDAHDKRFDEHDHRFDEHDKRFDRLDQRLDEMRLYVNHALGLGTVAGLKDQEMDVRVGALERRLKAVEDKVGV